MNSINFFKQFALTISDLNSGLRSNFFKSLLEIISEFQILSIVFILQIRYVYSEMINNQLLDFLQSLSNIFIKPTLSNSLFGDKQSNYFFYGWLIFLMIVSILKTIFIRKLKLDVRLVDALSVILKFNESYMFFVATHAFLRQGIDENMNLIPNLLATFLLYIFTFLTSHFSFENPNSDTNFCYRNSSYKVNVAMIKGILSPLLISSQNFASGGAMMLLCELLFVWKTILLWKFYPWRDMIADSFTLCSSAVQALLILVSLLFDFLETNIFLQEALLYLNFLLFPLIVKSTAMLRREHLIELFCKENDLVKSVNEVFGKLVALDLVQTKLTTSYENNFTSLKEPFFVYILGKSNVEDWELSHKSDSMRIDVLMEDFFKNYIFSLLEFGIARFPQASALKIFYANYLNHYSKRFFRSIKILDDLKKTNLPVCEQRSYQVLRDEIEITLNQTMILENGLDVRNIIKYDKISSKLLQKIQENTQEYIAYWESFKREDLIFSDFYAKGLKLESQAKEINCIWTEISTNLPEYVARYYILYYSYLCLIRSAPHSADQLKNILKTPLSDPQLKNFSLIDAKNMYDENNILFIVSLNSKTMGHILEASRNTDRLLGYTQKDLMNKTIEVIMPSFISQQHRSIWKSFGESDEVKSLMHSVSYCKQKNGFFIPCDIYSAIYPYITGELLAISLIRPITEFKPFLLVREDGIIDAISESVDGIFHIPEGASGEKQGSNLHIVDLFVKNCSAISDQYTRAGAFSKFAQKNYTLETALEVYEKIKLMGDEIVLISFYDDLCLAITLKATKMKIFGLFCYMIEIHDSINFAFGSEHEDSELEIPSEDIYDVERKIFSKAKKRDVPSLIFHQNHELMKTTATEEVSANKDKSLGKMKSSPSVNTGFFAHEKFNTTDNNIAIAADIQAISENSSARSSVKSVSRSTEAMLYSTPIENQFKLLYYFGVGFVLLSCILLATLMIKTDSRIQQAIGNIELVEDSTILQRELTRISRMILSYTMIGYGVWSDSRYDKIGIPNIREFRQAEILERGRNLNEKKNKIMTSIKNLESQFQQIIVTLTLTVKDEGEIVFDRRVHPFQLITELFGTIINIAQKSPQDVDQTDPDTRFFINNAFDDLLVQIEGIQDIVVTNTQLQLNNNITLATNFAIGVAIASVVMLGYFILTLKDFLRDRSLLIFYMLSIDQDKIDVHMIEVTKFLIFLSEHRESSKMKKSVINKRQGYDNKKRKKKYANMQGLNNHLYRLVMYSIAWISTYFLPLITLQIIASSSNNSIISRINSEARLNTIMYDMDLLISGYYLNVTEGNTRTVKNIRVDEMVPKLYDSFSRSSDFFAGLQNENSNGLLKEYISGDLCNLQLQTQFTQDKCNGIGRGSLKFGIMGVNSLVARAVKNSIDIYENSPQTLDDKKIAFLDEYTVDSEIAMDYIVYPAYLAVQNELHDSIGVEVLNLKNTMIAFIIPFLVLQFLFGIYTWKILYLKFKSEKLGWRKIYRHIPFTVVRTNKLLMGYLSKHSDTKLNNLASNV